MNTSNKIPVNKSVLLSLKAELLKKQEEAKAVKHLPQHSIEHFKPKPSKSIKQKYDLESESAGVVEEDNSEQLRKSKAILEQKAKLYENLVHTPGLSDPSGRYLVEFDKKTQEVSTARVTADYGEDEEMPHAETGKQETNITVLDDEWLEYTDCLGRARKVHKSDLDFYKRKDEAMKKDLGLTNTPSSSKDSRRGGEATEEDPIKEDRNSDPNNEEILSTDLYKESLRKQWEEKERQLQEEDRDIHYQDVLFNEARAHGVGYYAFSTSDEARRGEQAALAAAREQTRRAQQAAAERRAATRAAADERVRAARARRRLRAGLPAEDEQEKKDSMTAMLLDFVEEQKKVSSEMAEEEARREREETEKIRAEERKKFIREWDVGKESITTEGFREMTQEEWVDKQREKRYKEFAPPQEMKGNVEDIGRIFDEKGSSGDRPLTWSDVRPSTSKVPQTQTEIVTEDSKGGLYFSSVQKSLDNVKARYKVAGEVEESTPIVNELSSSDDEEIERSAETATEATSKYKSSAEIAPPTTFEYYGPPPKKARGQTSRISKEDVEESINKGLEFLQSKSSKSKNVKGADFF